MPRLSRILTTSALALAASPAFAQPDAPRGGPGRGGNNPGAGVEALVERMLTFDANQDGSLTKAEVSDERLHALFGRADADGNGTVTKAELKDLFTKESAALAATGRGPMGGPGGGPGGPAGGGPNADRGPGGNRGRGPGGPGGDRGANGPGSERGPGGPPPDDFRPQGGPRDGQGRGGPGGTGDNFRGQRPRPGQILPQGLQDRLNLTDDQRRRVNALQEIVDTQLDTILTPEQKQMLGEVGPPPGQPGGPGEGPPRGDGGPGRGEGGPGRNRQRPNPTDRPARPATEP
ncbi:MAG: EF-hand domain-containing protein [Gemmataceae bacterium]|nr:EF-hand domain-containing protein [Gemmataceae bacterium]